MNHFIELPDGTIINVAHVRTVGTVTRQFEQHGNEPRQYIGIDVGHGIDLHPDFDGSVYTYFQSIAQQIPEADDE